MKDKDFLIVTTGHFATDLYLNFLPALLPVMAIKLNLSLAQAGLVTTCTLIAANFFQPIFGHMFDRRPAHYWMPLGLVVSGVLMCVAGIMNSYFWFALLAIVSGIGNGLYHPGGSVVCYQTDEQNRGFLMSVFSTAGALGYAVAPALVAFLIVKWGLPSLLVLALPLPVLYHYLRKVKLVRSEAQTFEPVVWSGVFSGVVLALILSMVFRAWGHLAYTMYLPFLLQEGGMRYATAANLLTIFLVVGAVGGLVAGKFSDFLGRNPVIITTMLGATLFSAGFLLTWGWISIVLLILSGLMVGACQPVMVVLGQELMPGNIGLASGISMGLVWGIGSLGIYLNGLVADHFGLVPSFWVATVVLGLGTVFSLGLINKTRKRGRYHECV